jgi:hypothetical protein
MPEVGITRGSALNVRAGVNDGPPLLKALRVVLRLAKRYGHRKIQPYQSLAMVNKNTLR